MCKKETECFPHNGDRLDGGKLVLKTRYKSLTESVLRVWWALVRMVVGGGNGDLVTLRLFF